MTKEYQKISVAGGEGFVGQNVMKKLKEQGLSAVSLDLATGHDFCDFKKTLEVFEKEKFDAVINAAAFVGGIQFGYKYPAKMYYDNIIMTSYLMEASRLTGVKRFVNIISNCVYPARLTFFKEDQLWDGAMHESVLPYGFAKRAGWVQGWSYQKQYGFDSVHLICASMYGPGDHFDEERSHALGALIKRFVEAKRNNQPEVALWGSGKPIREWMYVEDGAEAIAKSLFIKPYIQPINIGGGSGVSVTELAELIKQEVGYEGKITYDTSKPDGVFSKVMDNSKMKAMFNWEPRTDIKEGIKKAVTYYQENF